MSSKGRGKMLGTHKLEDRVVELEEALAPFAQYAKMRNAMPLKGLGNSVHAIHLGTEWGAEITMEHVNEALRVLEGAGDE